jgi:hypothetical protein
LMLSDLRYRIVSMCERGSEENFIRAFKIVGKGVPKGSAVFKHNCLYHDNHSVNFEQNSHFILGCKTPNFGGVFFIELG